MKIVVIEPLGVEKEQLLSIAEEKLPKSAELVCYDTRVTDTEILIERGRDADVVVVANLPLNGQVIRGFQKLKLLSVAFTGVDHIDLDIPPWLWQIWCLACCFPFTGTFLPAMRRYAGREPRTG